MRDLYEMEMNTKMRDEKMHERLYGSDSVKKSASKIDECSNFFVTRKEFIERTGVFVTPQYYSSVCVEFEKSHLDKDKFINEFVEKHAYKIEEISISGTLKLLITDTTISMPVMEKEGVDIIEVLEHLTSTLNHKEKYAENQIERYKAIIRAISDEILKAEKINGLPS